MCPTVNLLAAIAAYAPAPAPVAGSSGNGDTSAGGPGIFAYRYDVHDAENTAAGLGVPHIFEAAAIFGPGVGGVGTAAAAGYGTYNAPVVPVVMDYWISFVRALDPNVYRNAGAPRWEAWKGCDCPGDWDGSGGGGVVTARIRNEEAGADDVRPDRRTAATLQNTSWRRLVIDTGNTRMEDVPAEQVERCDFWEAMARVTRQRARRAMYEG